MRPRPENLTRTSVHWQTVQYPHISLPQPHAGNRFEMEHTPPDDDSHMAAEKERMISISSREYSRNAAGVTPSVVRSDRFFSSAAHWWMLLQADALVEPLQFSLWHPAADNRPMLHSVRPIDRCSPELSQGRQNFEQFKFPKWLGSQHEHQI